jgi:peptidyl-prolyl cis-trans isomerase D
MLQQREALRLAREAGEARLAELRKQPSDAGFQRRARRLASAIRRRCLPAALNEILRVPADKLPTYVGAETDSGYLIAQCGSVRQGRRALDAGQREAQMRVIAQQAAAADEMAYAEGLKAALQRAGAEPELQARRGAQGD